MAARERGALSAAQRRLLSPPLLVAQPAGRRGCTHRRAGPSRLWVEGWALARATWRGLRTSPGACEDGWRRGVALRAERQSEEDELVLGRSSSTGRHGRAASSVRMRSITQMVLTAFAIGLMLGAGVTRTARHLKAAHIYLFGTDDEAPAAGQRGVTPDVAENGLSAVAGAIPVESPPLPLHTEAADGGSFMIIEDSGALPRFQSIDWCAIHTHVASSFIQSYKSTKSLNTVGGCAALPRSKP